jgi:hypothetical protein
MSTFITALLPILILIFIVGIVYSVSKARKSFMTIKITHWLVLIYMGVLLLSTAMIPFITDNQMDRNEMHQVDIDEAMNQLDANLRKGNMDQIDASYLLSKERFEDYQNQTLRIGYRSEYGSQVFVERHMTDDDHIEVFTYANGLLIGGLDFSDKLIPHKLELTENTLTIIPTEQNIRLSITSASFPVGQFTGESIFRHSFSRGEQVIYLRVPKDLKLIAEDEVFFVKVGK